MKWKRFLASKETTQAALEVQLISAVVSLAKLQNKPKAFCVMLESWHTGAMEKLRKESQKAIKAEIQRRKLDEPLRRVAMEKWDSA